MAFKRIISLFLLLSATWSQTDAELSILPQNIVTKINQSVYFNCSTTLNSDEMFWLHGSKYVYAENRILKPYDKRFKTEQHDGSCNLVIQFVEAGDAGEYTCSEGDFTETPAELIVLDNDPVCQSNLNSDGVIRQSECTMEPDQVELSCSVTFRGNTVPTLEWMKVGDDKVITENVSIVSSGNVYGITLKLKSDKSLDKSSYVCQIMNTNFQCNSEIINVLYSDGMVTKTNLSTKGNLTCIANSTVSCSYLWYRGNDIQHPLANNETLINPSAGEYQCRAMCNVSGIKCTFDVMKAFVVAETLQSSTVKETVSSILAAISFSIEEPQKLSKTLISTSTGKSSTTLSSISTQKSSTTLGSILPQKSSTTLGSILAQRSSASLGSILPQMSSTTLSSVSTQNSSTTLSSISTQTSLTTLDSISTQESSTNLGSILAQTSLTTLDSISTQESSTNLGSILAQTSLTTLDSISTQESSTNLGSILAQTSLTTLGFISTRKSSTILSSIPTAETFIAVASEGLHPSLGAVAVGEPRNPAPTRSPIASDEAEHPSPAAAEAASEESPDSTAKTAGIAAAATVVGAAGIVAGLIVTKKAMNRQKSAPPAETNADGKKSKPPERSATSSPASGGTQ